MDFAKAIDLVIDNLSILKEDHLVTFCSTVAATQIDYLIFRRCDRSLYEDFKVILGEYLPT